MKNFNRLSWDNNIECSGQPPHGRYDHAMHKFNNNPILFGGRKQNKDSPFCTSIYLLKLDSLEWCKLNKKIDPKGLSLKRSEFVSAVVLNKVEKPKQESEKSQDEKDPIL